jgi:hypothetical protein
MRAKLGYDRPMRYWTRLSTLSLVVMFALSAQAQTTPGQTNGVPASVTSPGFGGRQFNGVPPSVTSFGFGGRAFNGPPPGVTSVTRPIRMPGPVGVHQPPPEPMPDRDHHRQHQTYVYYPYFIPYYPVMDPYAYGGPVDAQTSADPEAQDQYEGGPTIFDRRGPGERAANDYADDPPAPVAKRSPQPEARVEAVSVPSGPPPASPVIRQPNTILVFKDGHRQEVSNYAIVGTNLFDLTPGHRLKIALADLDVAATQRANEDQGVDFTLPVPPNGN